MRALCVILAACSLPVYAEDWPRFRGHNGSGLSKLSSIPVEFGAEKNLSWKVSVGPGHSSPVVCGKQLYLTSFTDDVLRTQAFDVQTGKTLWSGDLPRDRKAKHHNLNNAASPSPACDDKGVVVFFADFGLAAWNQDGKPGWRIPFSALVNNHGMASSPVLAGNRVILVRGSDQGSEVFACNRDSGKPVWRDNLAGVTYSTPAVTGSQVFVVSTGEVVAFDLHTGKRRWWMMGVPYQPKASPILSADGKFLYFSALSVDEGSKTSLSSYDKLLQAFDVNGDGQITLAEVRERKGPASGFVQIDINGDGVFSRQEQEALMRIAEIPHTAAAVTTDSVGDQTGKQQWSLRKGVPNVASPVLAGDVLYLFKEGGILTSVRAADGTVLKEGRIGTGVGPVYSSPVAAAGRLYIANQQGKVFVLKAAAEWEVLAVNDLGEDCFATPAMAADRLFVRTANTLWCLRQAD
ncbi:MAG: PQQ-binding-like beta-propeller repeat protein [Bryobacterales bacterium]|nr:PQQ-binding-like beta-propeller repeat protein [Bryobacterales bacterium]